ncbi:MAG TPA: nuclear transport factor 2 family protein [Gemmatimonadales bacterium]|nr:nuclear transport factor 2 family protein [Gemmatimonadales bacterium]
MTRNQVVTAFRWQLHAILVMLVAVPGYLHAQDPEQNKALARRFYQQIWFSPQTATVSEMVAPEYVIHDVGGIDGMHEPAGAQQEIADFFWANGTMGGTIDFQIAEGDLVATRWQWDYTPQSWWMKALMFGGRTPIPVINVFRIEDGKIVEIWNHRHDIDVGFRANVLQARGFVAGLVVAMLFGLGRRMLRRRAS